MPETQKKVTFEFVFNDGGTKTVDDVVNAKAENHLFWMKQADGNVVAVGLYNVRYFSYKDPYDSKENKVSRRARYDRERDEFLLKYFAEQAKEQLAEEEKT